MIRFLDFITPFTSEIFKSRKGKRRPTGLFSRVLGYSIVSISLLANYYLSKKVYQLSVRTYKQNIRLETLVAYPGKLEICYRANEILIGLVDNRLDMVRPIPRKSTLDIREIDRINNLGGYVDRETFEVVDSPAGVLEAQDKQKKELEEIKKGNLPPLVPASKPQTQENVRTTSRPPVPIRETPKPVESTGGKMGTSAIERHRQTRQPK